MIDDPDLIGDQSEDDETEDTQTDDQPAETTNGEIESPDSGLPNMDSLSLGQNDTGDDTSADLEGATGGSGEEGVAASGETEEQECGEDSEEEDDGRSPQGAILDLIIFTHTVLLIEH